MPLTTNIPRLEKGQSISSELLNEQADRSSRISREAREEEMKTPGALQRCIVGMFRYKSAADDHWVCRELTYDSVSNTYTELAQDVKIAKPWELRKTPFHGKTITINGVALTFNYTSATARTVTKTGGSENQIPIPFPTTNSGGYDGTVIWAAKNIARGTAVVINRGQPSEESLEWLDLNVAGRAWAKV